MKTCGTNDGLIPGTTECVGCVARRAVQITANADAWSRCPHETLKEALKWVDSSTKHNVMLQIQDHINTYVIHEDDMARYDSLIALCSDTDSRARIGH